MRIGHASIDENGKAKNGAAGDQTGKEVCIREWYSKPWDFVLRCKDSNKAELMAQACEKGCNNNHIGYDQNQRNTLRTQAIANNYDLSKIAVNCECDCSSFMTVCAECAGIKVPYNGTNAPTTSTMKNAFTSTGMFDVLTDPKYITSDKNLKRGDILVKSGSHTVMALDTTEITVPSNYVYGIDISSFQGNVDFRKVKASGNEFVILRSTTKNNQPDTKWHTYLAECDKNGLEVMCYKYSYALNEADAMAEAESVIKLLNGRNMTIWYDVENNEQINKIGKSGLTRVINAFNQKCMAYNLKVGIYCNLNWWNVYLDDSIKKNFDVWIARYGKNDGKLNESYKPNKGEVGWQYTSVGKVDGISGNVDMDVFYGSFSNKRVESTNTTSKTYRAKVTANTLNVRKGVGTSFGIVGTVKKDQILTILEEKDGWGRISNGWVSLKWVAKI